MTLCFTCQNKTVFTKRRLVYCFLVYFVIPYLQTQVEQTLDSVCDIMPHFLHDTCKEFTGQIEDQIKQIAESDPEEACEQVRDCNRHTLQYSWKYGIPLPFVHFTFRNTQVGLCPEDPDKPTPVPEPVSADTNSGFACQACKWYV